MSQDLRAKLKAARKKLEITQTEAAKAWGVPLGTLICWENNKRHPTPFTRSMLDTMLDEILQEEPDAPRQPEQTGGGRMNPARDIRPESPGGRRMIESDDRSDADADADADADSDFGLSG